jgi:hypothetical protein
MHLARLILIPFMAALAATFTIELPFTQVNYIHLLVSKKDNTVTHSVKDTHRLHKTYYEDQGKDLIPNFPELSPVPIVYLITSVSCIDNIILTNTSGSSSTLRGPPSLA